MTTVGPTCPACHGSSGHELPANQASASDLNEFGGRGDRCERGRPPGRIWHRHGYAPENSCKRRLSPRMRAIVALAGLLAALGSWRCCCCRRRGQAPPSPKQQQPEPTLTAENAGELCQRLFEDPKEYIGEEALRRRWDLRARAATWRSTPTLPNTAVQGRGGAHHALCAQRTRPSPCCARPPRKAMPRPITKSTSITSPGIAAISTRCRW